MLYYPGRARAVDNDGAPVNNAKLNFYVTGTATPATVYTDAALAVPHMQPLRSNAAGFFQPAYLDPSITYKSITSDENDAALPDGTVDPIIQAAFSQRSIGEILYPRTLAESTALVTVVNDYYPECYVDRYGTNTTPGTTSMVTAFNAAIKVAKQAGRTVRYGATWPYLLDAELDATCAVGAINMGFTIHCDAQIAAVTENAPYYASIIVKHTGHVFDCTGSFAINFENISVSSDDTTYPSIVWLLARNSDGNSQKMRFNNCSFIGKVSNSVRYNYGSEDLVCLGDQMFVLASASAGSNTNVITGRNISGITSNFTTIATGVQSCINTTFYGGQYENLNTDATSDVFLFESCSQVRIRDSWVNGRGRSHYYFDLTNASVDFITLSGLDGENSAPLPTYGLRFSNTARTCTFIVAENSYIPTTTRAVYADTLVTLDSCKFDGISEASSLGIEVKGTLSSSTIDRCSLVIIGNDTNNTIIGSVNNFTITTSTGSTWIEKGGTKQTWTPAFGTATHGDVATINDASCLFFGRMVYFEATITDTVSITATAGQTITGLPIAAARRSASVQVANATTGVAIGTGFIASGGTAVALPAISTGAGVTIVISGWYFRS